MKKVETMKVSGGEYAKVKSRMLQFRADNPRGKIKNTPSNTTVGEINYIQFESYILKDKSDENSADATGHARLEDDGKQKTFEKCETIAVGRALALLGYGADGEIASSEEMEEFEEYKQTQFMEMLEEASDQIRNAKTPKELKDVWLPMSPELKKALEALKDERKNELNENK